MGIIYLGGESKDNLKGIEIPLVLASTTIDNSYSDEFHMVTINDRKAAYESVKFLIGTGCKKIGIIISNYEDELALERKKGYKVPEDISIIGFDGIEESKYYYPSITTIEQPRKLMGEMEAKLFIGDIKDDKDKKQKNKIFA